VLVHGAAGAVGQALLVLGKLAGLELWGTARGEHAALVRELGATAIDYQREDFTRVLPSGFDVVFDGIGFERMFCNLKNWRATRYDRHAQNYLSALALAAIMCPQPS
jgi:NADPH:quinone reductase